MSPVTTTDIPESTEQLVNQGEFHAKRPAAEPIESSGHQPGKIVDGIRTSTLEVLPPGSAPKESTFTPNPDNTEPVSVADAESEATGGKDVGRSGRREGKDV